MPLIAISGTTPAIMNFDMDMAASVAIDPSGNVSLNPTFKMAMGSFGSGNLTDRTEACSASSAR